MNLLAWGEDLCCFAGVFFGYDGMKVFEYGFKYPTEFQFNSLL